MSWDHRGAQATGLLQVMLEFVGEAPVDGAAESEREHLGQERREAERLVAEQEQQRMHPERMEAERLAEWDGRVEREPVEAETEELERRKVLERPRGREAERERQEGETALWHQRTQETLKAIRDEAVRVEAAHIARGYGVRLAEEDGTLAASSWTRPRTAVDHREAARFPASRKNKEGGESGAARRSVVASRPRQVVSLFVCRWECRCGA